MPLSDTNLMTMMEQLISRCEAAESQRDAAEISLRDAELRYNNAEYKCSITNMKIKKYKRFMKFVGVSSICFLTIIAINCKKDAD